MGQARVTQKADGYAQGSQPHVHLPQLGAAAAAAAARISTAVISHQQLKFSIRFVYTHC